ncbi:MULTISPECIES: signal peptidase II [Prochlorococcus]|uniref:Lipoprotein signal peptidase n=1 Tax=Prochlorococcus marinus (strain SARG / CCMP1375 / SS120) TaxID=167539 RepID=Q7VBR0_PROMA|nr:MULTISPECIES: signal peptidase II [Prochlorococcus]AAQ00077.1 Lipoprotein signal peptidase [Prochlorococcus marinus subsp. marinus str. CCMP1375]KGG13874.1 Lipoprotein signal peptidase [Prochlorococcus marinus str. LG]KGG19007.1 Lipoprotein signal peptidase [Prochlorococcus marinus str. SS2]KGG23453.1 Lipoprotein signal peptidase [Prochlorococcus marinus str. SS35]KGG32311.1 Lipoprotein signal peptidase [Prochlorococcus marinus str. SS51]
MNRYLFKSINIFHFSFILILIDQATKYLFSININQDSFDLIPGVIRFYVVKNYGAAFSIFSNFPLTLSFLSLFVSLALIILICKKTYFDFNQAIAFSMLLGGTVGNGLDRWRLGYVVDFIQIVPFNFPVFNFADIAINIAVLFLLLEYVIPKKYKV